MTNEELRQQIIEELTTPGQGDQYSSTALLVANRARREWEAVALKWRDKNRELERKTWQAFYEEVCRRAESKMLKTGKLEGSHYAAMNEVKAEWQSAK